MGSPSHPFQDEVDVGLAERRYHPERGGRVVIADLGEVRDQALFIANTASESR
jgi:hypothetical protein